MKAFLPSLLLAIVLLCGCATRYTIILNSGSTITAYNKPKLQGNQYVYKDAKGQEAYVPSGRVREIAPSSMSTPRIKSGYSSETIK